MLEVPYEKLIAYAAGEISGPERIAIEQALQQNPAARATLARFAAARQAILADDTVDVPAATLAAAKEQFTEHLARLAKHHPSWLDVAKRVIADLVFDSRSTAALAGVRGAHQAFQLSLESPIANIDLQITPVTEPGAARWVLVGQVVIDRPETLAGVALAPTGTVDAVVTVPPDSSGMFRVSAPPGTYDLLISVGDAVVVFEKLELR